jgi:hypothetical protein
MDLYKLPEVFILQLKRFSGQYNHAEKNSVKINFPIEGLDLTEYVLNKESVVSHSNGMQIEDSPNENLVKFKILVSCL